MGEPDIAVKQVVGPLFFGSSDFFQKLISKTPKSISIMVFKLDSMNYIDQSGIYVLEEIISGLNTLINPFIFHGFKANLN